VVQEVGRAQKRTARGAVPNLFSFRLLAAARLAGDEVGGAGEEVLLRGFVGRGGGEELEGLEVIRLHHGVMRGGGTATGEEQDREKQRQLADDGRQVADDGVRRGIIDEFLTAMHQDERQENREDEKHTAHQAVALGGAMEDFRSGSRRGAGHDRGRVSHPTLLAILHWVGSGG